MSTCNHCSKIFVDIGAWCLVIRRYTKLSCVGEGWTLKLGCLCVHALFPIGYAFQLFLSHQCLPFYPHDYTLNSVISTFHNVTHSLMSQNPREPMFVVQLSLLIVTFLSLISQILSLMQTTKEVNPHSFIAHHM